MTGVVIGSRYAAGRRVCLLRSADQPAAVQHPLGPARQLPQHSHRLPATRRAAGLDGRRPGLHPHGHLQRRRGGVLHQVAGGRGRRPVARRRLQRREPRTPWAADGVPGLGRRGGDLPLDHLPGLRRHADPRAAPAGDDPLDRVVPPTARTSSATSDRGNDYGDWLAHRRRHAQGPDRHRVFRLFHAPGGQVLPGDRQRRTRRPSTSSSSRTSRRHSTSVTSPPTAASRATPSAATPWPCSSTCCRTSCGPRPPSIWRTTSRPRAGTFRPASWA